MKWLSILKTISGVAKVAAPIVKQFVRLPLLDTILNAIATAEQLGGPGAEKFKSAMKMLEISQPFILAQLEQQFGVSIPEAAADAYIRAQLQANVDLMNAIGMLPKKGI